MASRSTNHALDYHRVLAKTTWVWEGQRDCLTKVRDGDFSIYFALHEVLPATSSSHVYYAESSSLARKSVPPAIITHTEALCNVIAHEVAHLYLFLINPSYGRDGRNVHNREWLDLMLSLRERLIQLFCFCPKTHLHQYHEGRCNINFQWSFLSSYLRTMYLYEHGNLLPVKVSSYLLYIERLIHKLMRYRCYDGLFLLGQRMF
ncbi:SprT-like domain-containing protein [Vibrio harveyi]|uniref:SprT-like domain-containing protein n=1 Tax=Vibrio harveyi TaxID=669 RepID=UPI003CCFC27C